MNKPRPHARCQCSFPCQKHLLPQGCLSPSSKGNCPMFLRELQPIHASPQQQFISFSPKATALGAAFLPAVQGGSAPAGSTPACTLTPGRSRAQHPTAARHSTTADPTYRIPPLPGTGFAAAQRGCRATKQCLAFQVCSWNDDSHHHLNLI